MGLKVATLAAVVAALAMTSTPAAQAQGLVERGEASYYGDEYLGHNVGCRGMDYPPYSHDDVMVMAVGKTRHESGEWPCGTLAIVTGPAGSIIVERRDYCGGCQGPHEGRIDLSRAGNALVCGTPGLCDVALERLAGRVP